MSTPSEARAPRRAYPLIIGLLIAGGAVLVLMSSFTGGQHAVTVDTVLKEGASLDGKRLRLVGEIKAGSPRHVTRGDRPELHFVLTDSDGREVKVVYDQSTPDAFEEGRECIVEGTLSAATNTVAADKLTVKCPSKYQTEDGLVDRSPDYYKRKYGSPATPPPVASPSS